MTRAGDKLYRDIVPPPAERPPRVHVWRWIKLAAVIGALIGEAVRGLP